MTNKGRLLFAAAVVVLLIGSSPTGAHEETTVIEAMEVFLESWLVHDEMTPTVAQFGASDRALSLAPTYVLEFGQYDPTVAGNERLLARKNAYWADMALPPGVAFGYWRLLHALWPHAGRVDIDLDGLLQTDPKLVRFLDDNFHLEYLQKSPFIVFRAHDPAALDTFDAGFAAGGYGRLAATLMPSAEHPVMTMIADFRYVQSRRNGPLVTFWDEEISDIGKRAWRIQALGAYPEY